MPALTQSQARVLGRLWLALTNHATAGITPLQGRGRASPESRGCVEEAWRLEQSGGALTGRKTCRNGCWETTAMSAPSASYILKTLIVLNLLRLHLPSNII